MPNQTRNDMDTRTTPNGTSTGTTHGAQDWSDGSRAVPPAGEPGMRAREDFYRRAEGGGGLRAGWRDERAGGGRTDPWSRGGTTRPGGWGAEREFERGRMTEGWGGSHEGGHAGGAGMYSRGAPGYGAQDRGYDARPRHEEYGHRGAEYGPRGWADAHVGQQHPFDRARMGTTDTLNDYATPGPLGYGDYGHPGEGQRRAYGDMGFAHGGVGGPARHGRGEGSHAEHAEHGHGLLGRIKRRWRGAGECARDVMTRNPRSVGPGDSVQAVAQLMIDEDTGIVPVCDASGRLLGVVTDRDIACRLVARGVDMRSAKASDAMTDEVECVTEQESLHDVLRLMAEHQVRRVPVVARGDRLVGIISMGDIAREADVDEELQDTFEEISSGRSFWSRLR